MEMLAVAAVVLVAGLAAVMFWRTCLVAYVQVMEWEHGLLFSNGRFLRVVGAGRYQLIVPFLHEELVKVDTRLVSVAVPGQEILTKDKLPVRMTVIAQYRVADAQAAVLKVQNYVGVLYEEIQLALRGLVGAQTLEELLERKEALGLGLAQQLKPKAAEFGVDLRLCGLKDIVLPGEIKAILTKVAEAEKAAQASLITAREELAATRCQANTAKLIAENPGILKLKELQVMAELAKRAGQNTIVFGAAMEPVIKVK